MSANLRLYTSIVFGFEHVVRLVPDHAWGNASPCDEWNARQVAGHAMGVVSNVAARAGVGEQVDVFGDPGLIPGDDPAATMREIRNRYLEATDAPGVLRRQVTSRLGEMPLDDFLGRMCLDTLVHTWDLARATGIDERLDPGAVAAVFNALQEASGHIVRGPTRYAEAVEGGDSGDLQDQLLRYTGRRP